MSPEEQPPTEPSVELEHDLDLSDDHSESSHVVFTSNLPSLRTLNRVNQTAHLYPSMDSVVDDLDGVTLIMGPSSTMPSLKLDTTSLDTQESHPEQAKVHALLPLSEPNTRLKPPPPPRTWRHCWAALRQCFVARPTVGTV